MILHILSHQVSSRPTEESTKLTLNTPKEILDSNNIKPVSNKPTKWERAMVISSFFLPQKSTPNC